LFSSDISYLLIYGIIILTFYLIFILFSSDLTSHTINTSYAVIDSFNDFLVRYPSLKAFVSIDDLDLPKIMEFGTKDEKMVITQAIQSGHKIGKNRFETINALDDITQMIARKTHVF